MMLLSFWRKLFHQIQAIQNYNHSMGDNETFIITLKSANNLSSNICETLKILLLIFLNQ